MLQKEETNYDETSTMCSKKSGTYRHLLFTSTINPFCKFGEQTLKESYRMRIFKKKKKKKVESLAVFTIQQ